MSFQNNIVDWVSIDNQIKKQNEIIKDLRDKKKTIESTIYDYVDTNDLHNSIINTSDSKLVFKKTKICNPLTLKYIEDCLNKCIQNEDHIKHIMQVIKTNREFKFVDEIKRTFNK